MTWTPPTDEEVKAPWTPPEEEASKLSPLTDAAISTVPGFGPALDSVGRALNYAGPGGQPLRRMVTEGAAMTAGAAVAGNIGAGVANVIGGELSDIEDHPETAQKALQYLSAAVTPGGSIGPQFMQDFSSDPEGTTQRVYQELKKAGARFTIGATAQLISKLVGTLGPKPGGAFDIGSKAIPGLEEELTNRGYSPTPDKFTKSRVANVIKTAADQGMFSGDTTEALMEKDQGVALKRLNDTTTQLASGLTEKLAPSDIANTLIKTQQDIGAELQREIERQKYGQLDTLVNSKSTPLDAPSATQNRFTGQSSAPGVVVSMQPVKDAINDITPVARIGRAYQLAKNLTEQGRYTSFMDAHAARSDLGILTDSEDPNLAGVAKKLYGAISQAMEGAAKGAGEDVYSAWKDADAFTKAGKQVFNNDLVAKIFTQSPGAVEALGRRLNIGGSAAQINQLMGVIDRVNELSTKPEYAEAYQKVLAGASPETQAYINSLENRGVSLASDLKSKLRAGMVQDLQARHTVLDNKNANGRVTSYIGMQSEIDPRIDPEGAKRADLVFGKNGADTLRQELKYADLATRNNGKAFDRAMYLAERVGGGAVGAGVGGLVGHPWAGFAAGEITGVVGVPKFASYLMTHPTGQKYFLNGVKLLAEYSTAAEIKTATDLILKSATSLSSHYLGLNKLEENQ